MTTNNNFTADIPDTKWFDQYGFLIGELPEECWRDCSAPGQDASASVAYWRKKLNFSVPRGLAIKWLREFGAWPLDTNKYDTGLNDMSDDELAEKVLWLASSDMREQGEWLGLIH